ncbi:hypothetical protein GGR54DRAFT_634136 [Hypoxylon sp. NC1633]|nr:hypothetical protein GGR54DRAFT_634136 [Hypoxylon sp. NC1633]
MVMRARLSGHPTWGGPKPPTNANSKFRSCIGKRDDSDDRKEPTPCTNCKGYPFKVVCSQGWAGNLPCVNGPNGGCSRHNPQKLPIAYNKTVPSEKGKKPGIVERLFGPYEARCYDEVHESRRIWCPLHLDHSTVDPLDPIHASIPYALAYYHMNWVRNAVIPEMQTSLLSCSGTVYGDNKYRPNFQYWIHPYWHEHSFLLQHIVKFVIEPKKRNPVFGTEFVTLGWPRDAWTFQPCPHIRQRFEDYEFQETRGLMKASMSYWTGMKDSLGKNSSCRSKWRSIYGPHREYYNCVHCCTDSWVHICLIEDKIIVHVSVWKDLGNATTPFQSKWLAALRPGGSRWLRTKAELNSNAVRAFSSLDIIWDTC